MTQPAVMTTGARVTPASRQATCVEATKYWPDAAGLEIDLEHVAAEDVAGLVLIEDEVEHRALGFRIPMVARTASLFVVVGRRARCCAR